MAKSSILFLAGLVLLSLSWLPSTVSAQPPAPQPVDQSPEFATVRAKFENMTIQQLNAAGYTQDSPCVSAPPGGMGFHYINKPLWDAAFTSGKLDPQNPPLVLVDANNKVVGLEWESSKNVQSAPVLFGQTVQLLPGHEGLTEEHYQYHAYFRPNGQVVIATFDPLVTCTAAPGGLPPTGAGSPSPLWLALGLILLLGGLMLRHKRI